MTELIKKTTLYLPVDLYKRLKILSEKSGVKMKKIVEQALLEHLYTEEKKFR